MEVRPGYKRTEVAVIPQEWDVVPLEAITTHIGDGLHGTPVYSSNGGYSFINGNNLHNGKIVVTSDTKAVDHFEFLKHRKPLGDRSILMSINGTIGNLALFDCEAIVLGKSAAYLNVKPEISKTFVYHSLQTQIAKRQFLDGLTGSTIGNLGLATIRSTRIPIPPTETEQRMIATALSDVDALLACLDRLIAKKRDFKQAAMQQLLTGKTRLPGFQREWGVKTLKEIVSTPITDGPHLTPKFLTEGVPFLSVNNLVNYRLDLRALRFVSKEDHLEFSKKCRPRKGDILFGKAASVGMVALIDTAMELNIWSPLALIRVGRQAVDTFIFYAMQMSHIHRQIKLLTNSSSQGNIGMSDIGLLELPLPGREEQTAIATVLSDIDSELMALEARRNKTQDLKLGMMQELLTGKTRLVSTGGANA